MKARNRKRYLLATALAAVSVLIAQNSAFAAGSWQTYTTTSNWHCGSTKKIEAGLYAQTCIIVSISGTTIYYQAGTIATDTGTRSFDLTDSAADPLLDGNYVTPTNCADFTLTAGESRVCFSPTSSAGLSHTFSAVGLVDDQDLGAPTEGPYTVV